jgi:hypothetical protein
MVEAYTKYDARRRARDDAIRAARHEGHTLVAIGQAAGLSHEMIRRICEEEK